MRNRKINIFLAVLVLALILWMLKGTFFQPGTAELKAGFTAVSRYRNENNTGPVQYVFAVTVKDSIWSEMETYGNYQPHLKGGNTKVYYFMEGSRVPVQLSAGSPNFDAAYNPDCIAVYEKSAMGNTSLIRHPFK